MKEIEKINREEETERLSGIAALWFYGKIVLKLSGKHKSFKNHIDINSTSWIFSTVLLL